MSQFHLETGAYALDALDPAEVAAFEEHLVGCGSCRHELAEFTQTAAVLGVLSETGPPGDLRAFLLEVVHGLRPLPPDHLPRRVAASPEPRRAQRSADDELAERRARRRARLLTLAVAAVTVVALALGGWVYAGQRTQHAVALTDAALSRLLSASDARTYPVSVGGVPATFVVSRSLDQAAFLGADLPTAATGGTYQAWTATADGSAPRPDVTFRGGSGTQVFLTTSIAHASGLALSYEPTGGSARPTRVITRITL